MPATAWSPALLEELNRLDPAELFAWGFENHGARAAIITSFQDTGCVSIDLAHRAGIPIRVLTVDTLRLHPETYALIEQVEAKYGLRVERYSPRPERVEEMVREYGEYLFFDSKLKQEYCCNIRKVEPNDEALASLDVWFTGLRRDHSENRRETSRVSVIKGPRLDQEILKISPLADWSSEQVWDYIRQNEVPYNRLYDQGYSSIGCIICSTPTLPGEDKRAGRWRWFNSQNSGADKKECGIHRS